MAVLTVLMCFTATSAFAQLKEVRGVQTRVVEYQSNESWNRVGYNRHGFEFKNENNYPVWVEAELCTNGYYFDGEIMAGTYDTKSFTLQAGESYVWKVGDKMIKQYTSMYYDNSDQYYVKYKAYKAE